VQYTLSKREKLRKKLRNQPVDATMQDVETLLRRFGFALVRQAGSHHLFEYDDGVQWRQIVVPLHGRKVKQVYVEQVIALLDILFPIEEMNTSEVDDDDENT
jgi:predicted RNA binding protein YcfA (HicA-like mRNA interferase family)